MPCVTTQTKARGKHNATHLRRFGQFSAKFTTHFAGDDVCSAEEIRGGGGGGGAQGTTAIVSRNATPCATPYELPLASSARLQFGSCRWVRGDDWGGRAQDGGTPLPLQNGLREVNVLFEGHGLVVAAADGIGCCDDRAARLQRGHDAGL